MFALWRLIEILEKDLGGNTVAAEFMLFVKNRQVSNLVSRAGEAGGRAAYFSGSD